MEVMNKCPLMLYSGCMSCFYTDSTGVTDCYGVGRDVSSAGLQF